MKKYYTKKSRVHGVGIFANEEIKRGEFIMHLRGTLSTVRKQLLYTPEEAKMNPDWVGVTMSYWLDPAPPFNYLNHSCEPSAGVKGKVRLYALKSIKKGEEITVDYSTIEANPYWQMPCTCGSSRCRKIIKSITFLNKKIFDKYYPYLPTAFKKHYFKNAIFKHSGVEH